MFLIVLKSYKVKFENFPCKMVRNDTTFGKRKLKFLVYKHLRSRTSHNVSNHIRHKSFFKPQNLAFKIFKFLLLSSVTLHAILSRKLSDLTPYAFHGNPGYLVQDTYNNQIFFCRPFSMRFENEFYWRLWRWLNIDLKWHIVSSHSVDQKERMNEDVDQHILFTREVSRSIKFHQCCAFKTSMK